MNDVRVVMRWIGAAATLLVALVWLVRLGHGALSAPALSPSELPAWLDQRDTATATFAFMRVIALGIGAYLFVVIVAGGAARAFRLGRTTAFVDRITLPFARTLFGSVAMLGVIVAPPEPPQAHDTMVELPAAPPPEQGHATLHLLSDTPPPPPSSAPSPAPSPAAPAPSPPAAEPSTADTTWIVQHGESFWLIAQSHLHDVHGRDVDDREVAAYWRELIDANRSRLVTSDPDLLFTGQVIDLPAVPVG